MPGRAWLVLCVIVALALAFVWASDAITLQGERTVYTVECRDGLWRDDACTGRLVAGDRYRFRALKAHAEVLFWTSGSSEPAEKFTGCTIDDGRNWSCPPSAAATKTVTLRMLHGNPVPSPGDGTKPFHAVGKLRWWSTRYGRPS
jgi:hypothetical protein